MIRRVGTPPEAGRNYTQRVGVYALLPRGADLLLTCQYEPGPDIQFPGGGVDPGEHPLAALHREVREETGWTIRAPRRIWAFRNFTFMPEYDLWAEKVCLVYRAEPVRRLGPATESFHEPLWLPAVHAAEVLESPGDRACARAFAMGLKSP
jgi:8-oxo-dGTP diphosphatase